MRTVEYCFEKFNLKVKMKKYFLTFSLIAIVILLTSFTIRTNCGENGTDIIIRTIEGHRYIIATSYSSYSGRPGGVAIIHAESCKCKKH